jgi:Ni/Co efflux regulator RcnB
MRGILLFGWTAKAQQKAQAKAQQNAFLSTRRQEQQRRQHNDRWDNPKKEKKHNETLGGV